MGRYYRLSKKITDDMATAILNEINELENVQTARITEDNKYLLRNITWLVRTAKNPDFLILLFSINGYFIHAAYTEQLVFLIICEILF